MNQYHTARKRGLMAGNRKDGYCPYVAAEVDWWWCGWAEGVMGWTVERIYKYEKSIRKTAKRSRQL
jgi:hypothetical protein